jgi:hypothetical protein
VSQIFEYTFHPRSSPPVLSVPAIVLLHSFLPLFTVLSVLENCYFPVRHKLFTKDNFLLKRMAENLFFGSGLTGEAWVVKELN